MFNNITMRIKEFQTTKRIVTWKLCTGKSQNIAILSHYAHRHLKPSNVY